MAYLNSLQRKKTFCVKTLTKLPELTVPGSDDLSRFDRLQLLHGIEGLGPLRVAAGNLSILVPTLVIGVARDHCAQRVSMRPARAPNIA
jgi:hypothetical protein